MTIALKMEGSEITGDNVLQVPVRTDRFLCKGFLPSYSMYLRDSRRTAIGKFQCLVSQGVNELYIGFTGVLRSFKATEVYSQRMM